MKRKIWKSLLWDAFVMIINGILSHNLFCFSDCIFRLAQLDALCVRGGFFSQHHRDRKATSKVLEKYKEVFPKKANWLCGGGGSRGRGKILWSADLVLNQTHFTSNSPVYTTTRETTAALETSRIQVSTSFTFLYMHAMVFSNFASALFSSLPFLFCIIPSPGIFRSRPHTDITIRCCCESTK